jgi:hypothetical protein
MLGDVAGDLGFLDGRVEELFPLGSLEEGGEGEDAEDEKNGSEEKINHERPPKN